MKKIVAFIAVLIYMTCAGTVWGQIADGTYYMRNRQTGKFLTGGNNWGTQASLHETGMDFELKVSEGKYTINSKVGTNSNTYLYPNGDAGFLDGKATEFVFDNVEGNFYAISVDGATKFFAANNADTRANFTGNDKNSHYAQWELLTKQDLINGLNAASMDNPMNATFFISGFDFNRNDNVRNGVWQGDPALGGYEDYRRCAEKWQTNFDVYQELTGLPNGLYKLSVQGFYRAGNGGTTNTEQHAYLYANSVTTPLMNINEEAGNSAITGEISTVEGYGDVPNKMTSACDAFVAGLYDDNSVFVNVTNGTLRIGIKKETLISNDWACFDNFQLTYYGSDATITNPYTGPTATYYLQNVATGKYLQGGAEYGVRPVLGNGIEFRVEKVCDGIYNLYSDIKHTEGYLCDEGYIDHGKTNFIIQEQSSGIYTIATTDETCNNLNPNHNGTFNKLLTVEGTNVSFVADANASAGASQWRFVTEAERIAALNEATRTNPKDATFLIKGASFTQGDQRVPDKWKIDGGHWFFHYRDEDKKTDGAGGVVNLGVNSCDIYQTMTGLPNGLYEVSMQGCYHNFKDAVFYANSVSVALDKCGDEFSNCIKASHDNCTCRQTASVQTYGTDNYKKTLKVIVTDGTLRVGAKGSRSDANNFLIFDNFTLSYMGKATKTTYYMRNVATGNFVRAGGRYESQAIRDDWGLALDFIDVDNETVVIDSRILNTTHYQYLDTNGYLDSEQTFFTLETVGDRYAIRTADGKYLATSEGDNYVNFDRGVQPGDAHAQWELLTRDQLIEELKKSDASDSNPQDATFLIEGSNFGRHDLRNNNTIWNGINFNDGKYGGVESNDPNSPDNYANFAVEKYNENFDAYQTISGLPAGTYELTVQGYYRSGNTATAADKTNAGTDILRPILYVKQGESLIGQAPLQSIFDGGVANQTDGFSTSANGEWLPNSLPDAAKVFRDGHYMPGGEYNKVRFVVPSDGATVRIGVKKNIHYDSDWTAFDNFRLTYLGKTKEEQTVYEHEIGTTLGTFYLKNAETGTYLTAGGTDGVSAVLGDQMHQHSVYDDVEKYRKGVRETDFTFVVAKAEGYSILTGIGNGYLTRDNGVKVNGMLDVDKSSFILEKQEDNTYRIKHLSGSYLRYTADSEKKDTEVLHDWDFTRTLTSDDDFAANTANWKYEYSNGARWYYKPVTNKEALLIDGKELDDTHGLLFTGGTEKMRIYRDQYLRLDGKDIVVTIPGLKAGDRVTVVTNSPNTDKVAERYLTNPTNLTVVEGFKSMSSNEKWENIATVDADGEVSFATTGGINIYSIQVTREVDSSGLGFENTTNPDGNGYNWIFQTKEELIAELDPDVASESNPIDATFLLRGTAFHKDDSRNSAWTGKPEVGGTESNYVGFVEEPRKYFNVSQKITGVPDGVYEFTLQGYFKNTKEGAHVENNTAIYYTSTDEKTLVNKNTSGSSMSHITSSYYVGTNQTPSDNPDSPDKASALFEAEHSTSVHAPIRFRVENGTIILGVYRSSNLELADNNNKASHPALYLDNVRLTYLGTDVTTNIATPQKIVSGIHHKPSRFYELAEKNGDLTLDKTTYKTTTNNTTLSDEAMLNVNGKMIQHTPVYEETIYAKPGEKLEIVLPNSYTNKDQSTNRYYQRIYDYDTDGLFQENETTTGKFEFTTKIHTDATIRNAIRTYEGTANTGGGWVLGTRWGQQLVSLFHYTTPKEFDKAVRIGIDHSDFTDIGDMGMFGDLTEPTLGQRLVYTILPASEMTEKLKSCTGDTFLEEKSISFPTIWYGEIEGMNPNDLNAVALDMQIRNYLSGIEGGELDNVEISIQDDGTGITLATTKFGASTDRFIKFNYPKGGRVTEYRGREAVIEVKTTGGDAKNIARFRLHFVPNTELRPWQDIMGQGHLRRSPIYLDEHAVLIDQLDFEEDDDYKYRNTYPDTWPVGDEDTGINGVESWEPVKSYDQFNPYPLDFEQTSFAANYFNAVWGQYTVMKSVRIPSYKDIRSFKDVNQLYHDHYTKSGTTSQLHQYPGDGYFMYIDASNFPSSVATLKLQDQLCKGTTIHFSGWVSSMDKAKTSNGNNSNAPGYLLFSIVGIDEKGDETVIESFCPGPIRADAVSYEGKKVEAETYNNNVWGNASNSIWQQFAFSFVVNEDRYVAYALKIDNYCSNTSGGDMMVDDVRLYIQKAVPDIVQSSPICLKGEVNEMEIYTTFEQLLNAVDLEETTSEDDAYDGYVNKEKGGKIIPAAWYCFLDKNVYDEEVGKIQNHEDEDAYNNAFNNALVTTGGNGGYYQFNFSTCFEANNGGTQSYIHTTGEVTDYVSYLAKSETINNESGTERRIYLNPEDYATVPLISLPYYYDEDKNPGNEDDVISKVVEWHMNGSSAGKVYGHNDGNPCRYVDLSQYDELRIYQSEEDANTHGAVRCFFYYPNSANNNFVVSYPKKEGDSYDLELKRGEENNEYWVVDLEKVKEKSGDKRLIAIKAHTSDGKANVTAINAVRRPVVLDAGKDYYIVFRAYKGETGETTVGGPATFFHLDTQANQCAAMATFTLISGMELRYDGALDSEGNNYCVGQIATLKMEMQAINTGRSAVKEEDLFYDWWLGDVDNFGSKADGAHDTPYNILMDFRGAYPEATVYEGQPAKDDFSEEDREQLEEWITEGKFVLFQSSLNVQVAGEGEMHVSVMPIESQLEAIKDMIYCPGPLQIDIPVANKAPTAKNGFAETAYPENLNEVPLRIGLVQIQSLTDEAADSWKDTNNALYIPLRDVNPSSTNYNSFGKKKHDWGADSENELEIAAVYLAETNDPAMVSYGKDVDGDGNRELRYVGKMHDFKVEKGTNTDTSFNGYVQLTFNPEFANNAKEGYRYVLKTSFQESNTAEGTEGETNTGCAGDLLIPLYIVPEYQVWAGGADGNWANDDNWRRAENEELKFAATTDRMTNEANTTSQGFVPMDFTKVLMKSDSVAVLKGVTKENDLVKFDDEDGHTPDIQFHLAAKERGSNTDAWIPSVMKGTDIYCVPFYTNTAKEVHFEPHSQMLNTQYLTYEQAWVEYALESGRWYTLSSPLQGVVSGDMYLPRGTAKQETPYFAPITYNNGDYSRLAPAVYQQAWDKAEATLYRLERDHLVGGKRLPETERLTPTANVARAFDWSYAYNDVKVPFGVNGFSVKVDMSRIGNYAKEEGEEDVLLRLPKKDNTYNYYMYDDNSNGSQTVDLTTTLVNGKNLREQAGKLFTDGMPAEGMTVTLTNNSADNPYFLVGNPFMSGLDLDKFFAENTGLDKKYWILTKDSYSAGVKDESQNWTSTDNAATGDVAPLQAFFVKRNNNTGGTLDVTFTSEMAVQLAGEALQTRASGAPATLRLTAMRDGVESRAVVVCREEAAEGFSAGEDAEALFDSNLSHAPTLYTSAGDVAAAINVRRTLHGVPVSIASNDEDEVTLTFGGVENFGEELYLYDAAEGISTPIPDSGTSIQVAGNSHGRYYIVTTPLDGSARESVPVVTVQGRTVTVLSAFDEILSIEAFDAMGSRVYAEDAAGNRARFTLPAQGVYLITVKTATGEYHHKVISGVKATIQ